MTLHLMVTVNQSRQLVPEIDFSRLLKMTQHQALIVDHSVLEYIGNTLPERTLIVVGGGSLDLKIDQVVDHPDQAIEAFASTGLHTAVMLGFTREFNRRMLKHADYLHYDVVDAVKPKGQIFPTLCEKTWGLLYTQREAVKPLHRSIAVTKKTFKRQVGKDGH